MPATDDADPALLLERILIVVDEGRRTGTHKLLALLALIEVAQASLSSSLAPTQSVPIREVAERLLAIVWQHVIPYAGDHEATVLRQMNDGRNNAILSAAAEARRVAESAGLRTPNQLRASNPDVYARAIGAITSQLVKYPLPLLQRVDDATPDFLFESWPSEKSIGWLAREQGREEPVLTWLPGVAEALVRYAALLRPVAESQIVRDVARWNDLATEDERLRRHLFGAARVGWPDDLKSALYELQQGRCFYDPGGERVKLSELEVDHFLPWSRFHHDSLENLVLAQPSRNGSKSDLYAATAHVERWVSTINERVDVGVDMGWDVTADRTMALARAGYAMLPTGASLWTGLDSRQRRVEPMTDERRRVILAILEGASPPSRPVLAAEQRDHYETDEGTSDGPRA